MLNEQQSHEFATPAMMSMQIDYLYKLVNHLYLTLNVVAPDFTQHAAIVPNQRTDVGMGPILTSTSKYV